MVPNVQALISGIPKGMGSYAPIIAEVEAVVSNPQSNLLDVGDVIEKDPDLTARLLKLGNSPFYGFPSRLETVAEAVSLIGVQQVQDLLVASNVLEAFAGVSPEFVNMESFWRHSLACGIGARLLAVARRTPKPDKFFVAGLLHDVGRLVLYCQASECAQDVVQACQEDKTLLREAETKVLGFDHAGIGEALLRSWQYPSNLTSAVGCHHAPMMAGPFRVDASLVHVADHLVNAMQVGSSGEHCASLLQTTAWDLLNLPTSIIEEVIRSIDDQLVSVQEVFLASRPVRARR